MVGFMPLCQYISFSFSWVTGLGSGATASGAGNDAGSGGAKAGGAAGWMGDGTVTIPGSPGTSCASEARSPTTRGERSSDNHIDHVRIGGDSIRFCPCSQVTAAGARLLLHAERCTFLLQPTFPLSI